MQSNQFHFQYETQQSLSV